MLPLSQLGKPLCHSNEKNKFGFLKKIISSFKIIQRKFKTHQGKEEKNGILEFATDGNK